MRHFIYALQVPSAVGVGVPYRTDSIEDIAVQVNNTFTGTIAIEVSLDGAEFYPVASVTAPGLYDIPWPAKAIRANVSALTGAAPVAVVAGYQRG